MKICSLFYPLITCVALLENVQLHKKNKKKHYRKKKCFIHKNTLFSLQNPHQKYCNRSFPHCNPTAVEKCQQHQIYTDMAGRSLMQIPLPYMESVERSADSGTGNGWVWFNKAAIFTSSNYPFLTTIWNAHRGPAFTYGRAEVGLS